jgi:hypothetical protein
LKSFHSKKRAGTSADPIHKEIAGYCFAGALAGVEAFAAFLLATWFELAFAVVALVDFLAAFFLEVVAVVLLVELCGVAGALDGGALCANIAAAVNSVVKPVIRIVRFIFVFSCAGFFLVPLQIHLAAICLLEH